MTVFVRLAFILSVLTSCSSSYEWSDEEKGKAQFFMKAMEADFESVDISNSNQAFGNLNVEDKQRMLSLKKKALMYAEQIPDSILIKIHSELPEKYTLYKRGLSMRIQNLENGDIEAEIEGSRLIDEYADWYDYHLGELKVPKVN
jgi:hypothetical protein